MTKTPTAYLREQANALYRATKYTIKGDVIREATGKGRFRVGLDIVAPRINDYRHTILTVRHPLQIYSLHIADAISGKDCECKDEKQFLLTLRTILSSAEVRAVIGMLVSQSST